VIGFSFVMLRTFVSSKTIEKNKWISLCDA